MKQANMIWRAVLGVLLVLICLAGLCACRDGETPADKLPNTDGELVKVSNISGYTVIRSDNASAAIRTETGLLYNELSTRFSGISIDVDYTKEQTPVVNDSYEILIGETNRKESIDAAAYASEQGGEAWYYLGVHGNKIVITGSDDQSVIAAVRYFMNCYLVAGEENTLKVPLQMSRAYVNNQPTVVSTQTGDAFVAVADVSAAPYFADMTGKRDVTDILKDAIADVKAQGGGVVYLPAGTYRVSGQLEVPSYVALRGCYVDPDVGNVADGTVLLLDKNGIYTKESALLLRETSTVEGVTFYYEGQSVSSPTEYKPTVEGSGSMWTVKDCSFINSWYAIYGGATPKGMMTLENIKGTALWRGMDNEQSADICVTTDVYFSPVYWAKAGAAFGAPAEADIRALMKTNGSIGFTLGDCDRDTYENILLDGFATGIYNREPQRGGLCGSYYNVTIKDAKIGMDMYGISGAYGLLMTNCTISAAETAIHNDSSAIEDKRNAFIYLLNCDITGELSDGVKIMDIDGMDIDSDYTPVANRPTIAATTLYNLSDYGADATGKTDISQALQKALNDAAAGGGGIVYMPAGIYRLENPVEIGDKTVLMGAYQAPQKGSDAFRGTVILATYGRGGDENATASITVKGKQSGVTGMTVYYPENGVSETETLTKSPAEYSYFVRCTGSDTFVTELCLIAASRAVHFDGANGFVVDRLTMTVYDNGIRVSGSSGGVITRIHTNGTYHHIGAKATEALHEDWMTDSSRVYELIDTHLRPRMTLIRVEDSMSIQIRHAFHYGAKTFLEATRSDIFLLNCESGHISEGKTFALGKQCSIRGVNFIRENPAEYISEEEKNNVIRLYLFDCAFVPTVHVIR